MDVEHPVAVTMVYWVAHPIIPHCSSHGWEVNAVTGSLGQLQCCVRVLRTIQSGTPQVRQRLVVEVMVGQAVTGGEGGGVMMVVELE